MKRMESIDFLRGLAVLSMFITHSVIFTAPRTEHPLAWALVVHLAGEWGAGLFAFLLGLSFAVSIENHRSKGMTDSRFGRRTLRRAAALFVFGFFFPIVIWGFNDGICWDILTTLAGAIALLWFLRKARPHHLFALASVVVLFSPFIYEWLQGSELWTTGHYKARVTLLNLARGFLGAGYFPFFPWVAFALVGFGIGRAAPSSRRLVIVATMSALSAFLLKSLEGQVPSHSVWSYFATGFSFYPLSPPFFLIILAIVLALFAAAHATLDGAARPRAWMKIFRTFSRRSLTLYVLHYAALVLPQRLAGWWILGDHEILVRKSITVPQGLILGPTLAVLFYLVCREWERKEGRYSLEWWLKKAMG